METYEMRYFMAAAEHESVGKAASQLSISSPAISRTITRLEEELGVQLFKRVGRNIALTDAGKQLQGELSRILSELDDLKNKFKPSEHHIPIFLRGTEFGLSTFLPQIVTQLKQSKIAFSIEVKVGESSKSVERSVHEGESHIGIVAHLPSKIFRHKLLGRFASKTYVGPGHKLYPTAKNKTRVHIEELLKYEFASFLEPVFSEMETIDTANDGWRDDKFRRKLGLRTESIEAAIRSVECGAYICYLPEPITVNRNLLPLKIDGCPYRCETEAYLITKKEFNVSWTRSLF